MTEEHPEIDSPATEDAANTAAPEATDTSGDADAAADAEQADAESEDEEPGDQPEDHEGEELVGLADEAYEADAAADTETDTEVDAESPEQTKRQGDLRQLMRGVKLVPVVLALLTVISGGVTAWLYFKQYQVDQQTDSSVADSALTAASDGTVAVLSYSLDTLEKDFAAAKSHLTGGFLSDYEKFSKDKIAPAAKEKSLKTTAYVKRAGIKELHPDSAVVLIFVDQTTTTKDRPEPSEMANTVLVHLTRTNGSWLIDKFNPII